MSDFGSTTYPSARKAHRCEWCGEAIPVGLRHMYFAGKWEGEWQNWRMHDECYHFNSDEIADGFTPYEGERPTDSGEAQK